MDSTDNSQPPEHKGDYVSFTPPSSFHIPEPTEGESEFDVVCRFKPEGSKLCMVKLGDTDMPKKDHNEEQKPDYRDIAQGMVSDMS